jgi:hypothetical protein
MNWMEMLQQIFQVCIIPLLGVLTTYLIKYIQVKAEEVKTTTDNELTKKYVDMLAKTISDCVIATNQTYVDNMKKENAFDAEAQRHAFQVTYAAVLNLLTDEAKKYLEAFYGDLNGYITNKIEAEVNWNKTSAE